jgi:hypothetical protein
MAFFFVLPGARKLTLSYLRAAASRLNSPTRRVARSGLPPFTFHLSPIAQLPLTSLNFTRGLQALTVLMEDHCNHLTAFIPFEIQLCIHRFIEELV